MTSNGSFFSEIGAANLIGTAFQGLIDEANSAATAASTASTAATAASATANAASSSAASSASTASTSASAASASASAAAASAATAASDATAAALAEVQGIVSNSNKLINPFMEIDQANEGASVVAAVPFTKAADGYAVVNTNSASPTFQRVTDAPTGYPNSLKVTVVTGQTVVSGSALTIHARVEADDLADTLYGTAGSQPLTVTFWFKSSISGTYSASFQNAAQTRSYVWNFTYSSANVWQKFTQTVPGDIGGTWAISGNGLGLVFSVAACAGSTVQTTAGSWQTGNFLGTSSNTNTVFSTTGATFQLGPCKLEVGSVATPLVRTSFQQELARCQRYYEKSYDVGTAVGTVTTNGAWEALAPSGTGGQFPIQFKVTKRAVPTFTAYSTNTGASGKVYNTGTASDGTAGLGNGGTNGIVLFVTPNVGALNALTAQWTADARL